jgi:hypothetical protein
MLVIILPIVIGITAVIFICIGDKLKTGRVGTRFQRWCRDNDNLLAFSTFMSAIALGIALLLLVANRVDYASFPTEYEAVKITLNTADTHIEIERAAIVQKIIDMNRELATVKYWNDSLWLGWFWPDKVAKLEYIQ